MERGPPDEYRYCTTAVRTAVYLELGTAIPNSQASRRGNSEIGYVQRKPPARPSTLTGVWRLSSVLCCSHPLDGRESVELRIVDEIRHFRTAYSITSIYVHTVYIFMYSHHLFAVNGSTAQTYYQAFSWYK